MRKNGCIYTDNMALAAYLMARGVKFVRIQKSDVKKGIKIFVLEKTDKARVEKAKFLNGIAKVEPRLFLERYRDLRSLIRASETAEDLQREAEELYNQGART